MDFFDRQSYRLNKMILYGLGLWPYQSFNSKLITRTLGTLGVACFCLPQIIHVFDVINDFDGLFEALPTLFGGFIATVKTVGLITKSSKMRLLLDRIVNDWKSVKLQSEVDILEEYAMKGRQMSLGYAVFAAGPMMIFVTVPLCVPFLDLVKPLNGSRPHTFAYPGEYFVDRDKYAVHIETSQFIGCFFALSVAVGADTLFIILMHHVCAMFAVLSYRLRNATEYRRLSGGNTNALVDSQDYKHMMECIQLHTRMIKFSDVIVSTFGLFFFFDIGIGLLLQCASCVMIVIQMDNRAQLVKYGTLLLGQSLRLFFNSWIGQKLLDHSNLVRNAAYNGLWYEMSARTRRLLLLLQLRCEIPCKVTIAKLYVIDFQGFSMVIRTSMSYCTVMTSVRDSS